jgi:hypothetical protein
MSQPQIAVVGAAGMQAGYMLDSLAKARSLDDLLAIDRTWSDEARSRVEALGATCVTADVNDDRDELMNRLEGVSLIASLAGPMFSVGTNVLDLAIDLGADYMDICDDNDATELLLDRDEAAKAAGTVALVGMGSGPGTTNILCRIALDALGADDASVSIKWICDEADMTVGVVRHFLHCFATAFPGEPHTPDWEALEPELVAFDDPIGVQEVVRVGHPEPVTLPRFTNVSEVVNKGGIAPREALHFYWNLGRLMNDGASLDEVIDLYKRYSPLVLRSHRRAGTAMHLDVHSGGNGYRYVSVSDMKMEHATGLPAAAGVLMMLDGALTDPGCWAPECVKPADFFDKLRLVSSGGGGMHVVRLENGQPAERLRIRDLMSGSVR